MKLTAKLAYSQIKTNRARILWTLAGISLATAMIAAVYGFAASGHVIMMEAAGGNEFYIRSYNATLIGLGAFLSFLIITASVVVVSNSFRVSAGERTRQFGILKSVGATKKQISETIMYEGVFLCAIGIPVGIGLGLLVNLLGIQIINHFLSGIVNGNGESLMIHFVFAWQAILLSIIVAFFTVLLSAWLPARKAARIAAIDAIRGADEIKIKQKQIRGGRLIGRLFGYEGTLASKSLKRSRRNFRATVISLTVSVVLFITVGAFIAQMTMFTELFYPGIDATVVGQYFSSIEYHYGDNGEISELKYASISGDLGNQITRQLREFHDTTVYGIGYHQGSYSTVLPSEMLTPKMRESQDSNNDYPDKTEYALSMTLMVTDAENYAILCQRAGVPVGSNILVNQDTWYHDGGREVFAPLVWNGQTIPVTKYDNTGFDLPLHGELIGTDIPAELRLVQNGNVVVIVPNVETMVYHWFATPGDKAGFVEYADSIINDIIPQDGEIKGNINVYDIEVEKEAQMSVARLMMVLVYGFVGMLTLIGLTNVISTISANVRSRSREFAVLKSVGMTGGGLNRMLNLESILCSLKSLVIGVPLGIIGSYLSYIALDMPTEFAYELPWLPIVQCTLGVFVITWVIMRYAAARLRGGNIVETIREELG